MVMRPLFVSSMEPPAGKPEMTAMDFQGCAPSTGKTRQPPSKKKIVHSHGQRDLLRCTNKKGFHPGDILLTIPRAPPPIPSPLGRSVG